MSKNIHRKPKGRNPTNLNSVKENSSLKKVKGAPENVEGEEAEIFLEAILFLREVKCWRDTEI